MHTNLLSQIIPYLTNPIYNEKIVPKPFFKSLVQIIRINLLAVLISFLAGLIIVYISTKTHALDNHAVGDFINNESLLATFIFACIVAPLLEETAFRLWLINKPIQLSLGIVFFLFYYIFSFVPGSIIESVFTSFSNDNPFIIIAFYLGLLAISAAVVYQIITLKKIQSLLGNLFKHKYRWVFYGSALLFGLLHISNYQLSWTVALLTPILVLPQVSGGILLSYIRVTYGFWRGVIGHFLYNLLLLTPSLGLKLMTAETQKAITDGDLQLDLLSSQDKSVLSLIGLYFMLLVITVIFSNLQLLITYLIRKKA
jgi:Type II CAAX prenyl endopeptidase Rce1-like